MLKISLTGLIAVWWRKKEIPSFLKEVEIHSLHKAGDRLNLYNKRGIGLVSKLVLIMETILLNRISDAIDKAGTRSRAQGGARKGIHATDLVVALLNIIAHAKKNNKPLHVVCYDIYKFFDRIPHRGFIDAYVYFGFEDEVIALASIFWKDFRGKARTKYGYSPAFDIGIGNIQGLVGSPSRSGMFLDMFLRTIEDDAHGYRFSSDNFGVTPEHELDDTLLLVYGVAWVDDFTSVEESFDGARRAAELYNKFINHYTMKLVANKCQHFVINEDITEENRITITDYNGKTDTIPIFAGDEIFRCLGVMLNLNLNWKGHKELITGKINDFNITSGKRRTPAWLTAKITNSNAAPMITYGLSVVDLGEKDLSKIQTLLNASVKRDGYHSNFVPNFAYTLPGMYLAKGRTHSSPKLISPALSNTQNYANTLL